MVDSPPPDKRKHGYPPSAPTDVRVIARDPGAPAPPAPATPLWHYTTFDAYESISRTGVLWASQIQYLNDEQEFRHARAVIETELFDRLRASGQAIMGEDLQSLRSVYDQAKGISKCVICFSESRDQLSQWRGYGLGVLSIAIGFDRQKLEDIASGLEHGWKLERCLYSREHKAKAVAPIVTAISASWPAANVEGAARRDAIRGAAFLKWDEYLHIAPRLKHDGFKEEAELRLISMPYRTDGTWGFRRTATLIVPYQEFPLFTPGEQTSVIQEILVGPSPHRVALVGALSQLGLARGIRAPVRASDIPYR